MTTKTSSTTSTSRRPRSPRTTRSSKTSRTTKHTTSRRTTSPRRHTSTFISIPIAHPTIPTWAQRLLLSIIVACTLCIGAAFVIDYSFDPERRALSTIDHLADEYYIRHLYPDTLGAHLDDPATVLSQYTDTGLSTVRLRQLLYLDPENAQYAPIFSNESYSCDTNYTTARFYPVEPYGPRDYTVSYHYVCANPRDEDA